MRNVINPAMLAYRGVLIERPCFWCDTTDIHFEGLCNDGPCATCGVRKRVDNWPSHPAPADGKWRGNYDEPMHDWQPHTYAPADIDFNLPAFEAIVDVARGLGYPERYTSDLYRDYQILLAEPRDVRFLWAVRQWGTHMILRSDVGRGTLRYLIDNEPTVRYFYWNGFTLDEVNTDTGKVITALPPLTWTQVKA